LLCSASAVAVAWQLPRCFDLLGCWCGQIHASRATCCVPCRAAYHPNLPSC
jgi:hypothetical protein